MVTRLGSGMFLAILAIPGSAFGFTFPGNITNGLQAAGVGDADFSDVSFGGTTSVTDPENSGIITSQNIASVTLNASVYATASGSVMASLVSKYGNLSISGTASGTFVSTGTFGKYSGGGGVEPLNSLPNTAYQDTLTLVSATLPAGAPVSILFTNTTTAEFTRSNPSTSGQDAITSSFQATYEPLGGGSTLEPELLFSTTITGDPPVNDTRSQTLNLSVGDSLVIGGYLNSTFGAGFGGSGGGTALQALGINVLTPGVTYVASSGTTYTTATAPEPISLSLLALAVPLLARRRARA